MGQLKQSVANPEDRSDQLSDRINRYIAWALKLILVLGAMLELANGNWAAAVATMGIVIVTLVPMALGRQFGVKIPPEFELLAIVFVYASLFLGEVHGYYLKYWWWDLVLHAGSGLLMGIFGFLLVYVLNEQDEIHLSMKPIFLSMFAFMFAIGVGSLWEIGEFALDQLFDMNTQKSGLVDTMWDLIVNALGAFAISAFGYTYLKTVGADSFLERWIQNFIIVNEHLFRKSR